MPGHFQNGLGLMQQVADGIGQQRFDDLLTTGANGLAGLGTPFRVLLEIGPGFGRQMVLLSAPFTRPEKAWMGGDPLMLVIQHHGCW